MKKLSVFLVILLALCMLQPATAQMRLGVTGGLNLANLSVDPDEGVDISNRTAIGFGGILDFTLSESVMLHLEPMYLQKGAKAEEEGVSLEVKLAYLEVPAMLKFAFGTSDTKPYFMVGPTIGFNMSSKISVSGTFEGNSISLDQDVKDETKSIDFGLAFGAGLSMPAGVNSFFVEARYTLGLSNVLDLSEAADTDATVKTKGIQIFAGITFPIGSE